jgi:hypothetical protein
LTAPLCTGAEAAESFQHGAAPSPAAGEGAPHNGGAGIPGGRLPKDGRSGFTLTEIAVALGIFSFALVSLLGMLSVGLKNSRKATLQTSASNVLSAIASDIQSSTFDKKGSFFTSPRLGIICRVNADGTLRDPELKAPTTPACVNESGTLINPLDANPLERVYRLEITKAVEGTLALRVRIVWPPKQAEGAREEGAIDSLVPLPFF